MENHLPPLKMRVVWPNHIWHDSHIYGIKIASRNAKASDKALSPPGLYNLGAQGCRTRVADPGGVDPVPDPTFEKSDFDPLKDLT